MNLYILGNGFDIANELKTKYCDFANWLKINNYKKYCQIKENFGLDNSWSNFENKIAKSFWNIEKTIDSYDYENKINILEDIFVTNTTLIVLIKKWLTETIIVDKIITNKNIINFNYTDYIQGDNVFNIHESISSQMFLHFGHSQPKKLENKFSTKQKLLEFGQSYKDPNNVYNNLTKWPEVAKFNLINYLHRYKNKKIKKLIFYGFSFGQEDIQYFETDIFNKKLKVDFYYSKEEDKKILKNIKSRVKTRFKNVKFIKSKKLIKL